MNPHRTGHRLLPALLLSAIFVCDASAGPEYAWARGEDGQRVADFGNGTFVNPVLPGDHADPSVLKVGSDYYMVHSSFHRAPGLLVWHSRDLVNWEVVGPALREYVGSVWAPDLCLVNGRYYIYFPVLTEGRLTNMVVTADDIRGPWSDPVDLDAAYIDPGHAVDAEGKRWLFFNAGFVAPLTDDGLSLAGPARKVYDGWAYPEDWDVEGFSQEGPKILRHGGYYYMVLAEGGTAGPATSHMIVMARAKNLLGPWENSPYNPVVHTESPEERWWSRGHGTLVEGPDGESWYLVYHGYEKGYHTLGRQTLLEKVTWTDDGWVKTSGRDVAAPMPIPAGGAAVKSGMPLSDDFSTDRIGTEWAFYRPTGPVADRYRYEDGALVLKAGGTSPKDSPVMSLVAPDRAYAVTLELEKSEGATAGLLLFYNERLFVGLGFSDGALIEYRRGEVKELPLPEGLGRHLFLRIKNDHNVVSLYYGPDGKTWTRYRLLFEVSGYNHNVMGEFLALNPAILAAGTGEVRLLDFSYSALP